MRNLPSRRDALAATLLTLTGASAFGAAFAPTGSYSASNVEGWRILTARELRGVNGTPLPFVHRVLEHHLFQITRVVPAAALARLREIPIWIELNDPKFPCSCYHPSADWLRDNGLNPDKAGAVEISNCANFVSWSLDQPWMVLHELAHGYHFRVVGEANADVQAAYDNAVKSGGYDSVLRSNGHRERHYALTNAKEYFAECSEAFFGTNDFYPFLHVELADHDPVGFAMMRKVWGAA